MNNQTRDEILKQRELKKLQKKSKKSKSVSNTSDIPKKKISATPKNTAGTSTANTEIIQKNNFDKHKHFSHLYPTTIIVKPKREIHPIFLKLGQQYADKIFVGSNARCLALLKAVQQFLNELHHFSIVLDQEFARKFECILDKQLSYLNQCRPMSTTMIHASKYLKYQLLHLSSEIQQIDDVINRLIENYIYENIEISATAISLNVQQLVKDGDVIMTYACSSLVERVLRDLHKNGVTFKVIVVDSLPFLEGRTLLQRLLKVGIKCSYIFISAINFAITECTKVLIGAHTLLTNGYVMSRIGTSQLALTANSHNVPVLVCCETYKFSDRVQIDSFVYNEISRPFALNECFDDKHNSNNNNISDTVTLKLRYDVTPSDLVTAVVTELAVLPCTSVPVVLRVKPPLCY